jgi:hypothetical protein
MEASINKKKGIDGLVPFCLQASSMLPQRHVNHAIPHKDIWIPVSRSSALKEITDCP